MSLAGALKPAALLVVGSLAAPLPAAHAAAAPSAELARKCRAMMVEAFPPAPAGSRIGNAQQQRDYFQTCIDRSGQMDDAAPSTEGRGQRRPDDQQR
jgi:hypothetical protein